MRWIFVIISMFFCSCSSAAETRLEEMEVAQTPVWDMVSIQGLEVALQEEYDPEAYNISLDVWMDYQVKLKIYGIFADDALTGRHMMSLSHGCSALEVRYENSDGWIYVPTISFVGECVRTIPTPSGISVLPTYTIARPYLVDAALEAKGYLLSEGDTFLSLINADDDVIGVFQKRRESVQ